MTYEPDDIAHVRLPLISLALLVALPAALIPVLQFLSVSVAGSGAPVTGNAPGALSLGALPASVVGGSIIGLLVAYVIGGRKSMFLAVFSIVVAVTAMLAIASPATFLWGRTTLNLAAGALLVLPILVLGHYGSHRQIARGMPGLILGPFVLVALVGLLTRPEFEDRIAAMTAIGGLDVIDPMGWLAIVLTVLLVLSLFRAMGRARGGRPNALFSAELRADARAALGFVLTGPQIYALLIAMALAGHAATIYLGDFARKAPLEGFGIQSTIAATICLGFGGFVFARIFGPGRRQLVLATTIIFLLITTALMAGTDIMFAPTAESPGIFVWPYTQEQLVLLVLTCAAMAMLGAAYAMIWLSVVEVGIGALATVLLITVLVARIGAPATVPLLPIPDMWLSTTLLGAALVLVTLGTLFGRRTNRAPAPAPSEEFAAFEPDAPNPPSLPNEDMGHDEPGLDPVHETIEPAAPRQPRTAPPPESVFVDAPAEPAPPPVAPREPVMRAVPAEPPEPAPREPIIRAAPAEPPEPTEPAPREPVMRDVPRTEPRAAPPAPPPVATRDEAGEPAPTTKSAGLPWRRKRRPRKAPASPAEPAMSAAPRRQAPPQVTGETPAPTAPSDSNARHEAVHDTHIDWAKLGATVEDGGAAPTPAPDTPDGGDTPSPQTDTPPPAKERAVRKDDPPAGRPTSSEPVFTRHDSTIFDFDRLRTEPSAPGGPTDQTDKETE